MRSETDAFSPISHYFNATDFAVGRIDCRIATTVGDPESAVVGVAHIVVGQVHIVDRAADIRRGAQPHGARDVFEFAVVDHNIAS